jgi:CDGSH-type Zn-finger protein
MARLVKRFRKQPYAVTIGGETKAICGCGLSAALPLCDGTHKITESEEPDKLDWYDDAGNRHVATDCFGRIRSDKEVQNAS